LLTSTSTRSSAAANAATDPASVTSSGSARAPIDDASASSRSTRRAPTTTSKPSAASRVAVAAPMPLDAPVTTATRRGLRSSVAWVGPVPGMKPILALLQD
jgi:hypothetical protein